MRQTHEHQPTPLAPALAAGALGAATLLNHATGLPGADTVNGLLGAGLACALLWLATLLGRSLVRHRMNATHDGLPPAERPGRLTRPLTRLLSSLLGPATWLRFSALLLSAWLLTDIAVTQARNWLQTSLPLPCEAIPLTLSVRAVDMPVVVDGQGRIIVEVLRGQTHPCAALPHRISLGWSDTGPVGTTVDWPVRTGEVWRVTVKLRRPITTLNFDGFDVHRLWLEQDIGALGRILPTQQAGPPQKLNLPDDRSWGERVARWRQRLSDRINAALPPDNRAFEGIAQGLAIGLQKHITPTQWSVLSATGTSHLVSISGMHVTLLAGWLAWAVRRLALRIRPLATAGHADTLALLTALPTATLYALLAGWGIPAQRTIVGLALGCLLVLLKHHARPLDLLCLGATVVVMCNPWCANSAGFLLSFGAVGILIFSTAGRARHSPPVFSHPIATRAWGWLGAQAVVFIGLMPLSVALFGQYSWVSPIANAVAIGWIGLITTPLLLAGCLLDIAWLIQIGHDSVALLWPLLQWLAGHSLAWLPVAAPPLWVTGLSVLGGLMALMPSGLGMRTPGLLMSLMPFLWPVHSPEPGEFEVTVLDIGQGNSIAIRTAHHVMLVDAGNAPTPRQDQGRMTVMPWLNHRGRVHWDAVAVSHNDSDHAGGMAWVLQASTTTTLLSNPPFEIPAALNNQPGSAKARPIAHHIPCTAGTRWTWDGVTVEVLFPQPSDLQTQEADNARSCVLRISSAAGSVLLPGDIGVDQEALLLQRHPASVLHSDVILVPHHGSKTSSSNAFVQTVTARHAVFQVGLNNRYGHPDAAIEARWKSAGANILRTDQRGAIRFAFLRTGIRVETARQARRRFWHLEPSTRPKRFSHHNSAVTHETNLPE